MPIAYVLVFYHLCLECEYYNLNHSAIQRERDQMF